jgi:hypothetical protein
MKPDTPLQLSAALLTAPNPSRNRPPWTVPDLPRRERPRRRKVQLAIAMLALLPTALALRVVCHE